MFCMYRGRRSDVKKRIYYYVLPQLKQQSASSAAVPGSIPANFHQGFTLCSSKSNNRMLTAATWPQATAATIRGHRKKKQKLSFSEHHLMHLTQSRKKQVALAEYMPRFCVLQIKNGTTNLQQLSGEQKPRNP